MSKSKDSNEVQIPLQGFFEEVAGLSQFTARYFRILFIPPYEFNELQRQAYLIGNKSLPLVGITGFIMGLVFTMQSQPTMEEFGAGSWVPSMVGVSMVREIGPVITALICAGKVGSGMGAELASMRVTEQIDAMEVSGTNPFRFLVSTRILATTLMVPILVILSDAISLVGSWVGVNLRGDVSFQLFFTQVFNKLEFSDVIPATIKTFFFGMAIGLIACYKGYTSDSGTEGVGRAANAAVVMASLVIFILDMIAVQITRFFVYA